MELLGKLLLVDALFGSQQFYGSTDFIHALITSLS
jgi:hypothetical protein